MKTEKLIPFAPILIESTRSIGYSFESALADIIDNSIAKRAQNINIYFSSLDPQYVAVLDDGTGMSEKELLNAMRFGSKSSLDVRDKDDLGRFGLGLKTASLSQCRKLTVISKQNGVIHAACWDLDYVIKNEDWSLQCFNHRETEKLPHVDYLDTVTSGTIVIWENFDRIDASASDRRKVFDENLERCRNHISLVFHRFMENEGRHKPLKIYFNEAPVEPTDPFLTSHPATQPLTEQTLIINGTKIQVKPYILPYASKVSQKDRKKLGELAELRSNQGFYVYRNRRLIIWGSWFRLIKAEELNKLARIRVDIPNSLDAIWEIDVKKSTASLPDIIKEPLRNIVRQAIAGSEKVYKYRGRKTNDDNLEHIWITLENRGKYEYLINRDMQIYKHLENLLDDEGRNYLNLFVHMLEGSFPYGDIYFRLAKDENSITTTRLEFEDVYRHAQDLIASYRDILGKSPQETLTILETNDFFMNYPDVIKKLKEEYQDEC